MKKDTQKGQSLLEFTAMLMFLLIVVLGIVELGRMFTIYINLRDAAEEGVIYGSLSPTDCSGITARALDNVNNIAGVDVAITIGGVSCETAAASPATYAILGNEIRVTVTLDGYTLSTPFIGSIIGQTHNLWATITGTILRPLSPTPVPTS
jgi:Flp pilus assembly protein TadG